MENNFVEVNKALWNERTKHHINSAFYDMSSFLAGNTTLKNVELDLLGDVKGKTALHLQCHFGQDTMSLSRMGAKATGVDFSDEAVNTARRLAGELSLDTKFICCNLYDLPQHLNEQFDIVFTSYGTVGWLPDMKQWAGIVSRYLKPGGKFIIIDFHPTLWMFDNNFTYAQYSYFNTGEIVEEEQGTYADRDANMKLQSISWNHSLSEIMQNLIKAGLRIEVFNEYDYSPYNCFANTVEPEPEVFRIKGMEGKLPMIYAIKAEKPQ
jgi:ubiquinone/menaquinone biosynthesis C-methylase UbiE